MEQIINEFMNRLMRSLDEEIYKTTEKVYFPISGDEINETYIKITPEELSDLMEFVKGEML